jgi:hypothetical protein
MGRGKKNKASRRGNRRAQKPAQRALQGGKCI